METKLQSAGDVTRGSSAAPLPGPQTAVTRDGGILLSELIDRYALAYAGRDIRASIDFGTVVGQRLAMPSQTIDEPDQK